MSPNWQKQLSSSCIFVVSIIEKPRMLADFYTPTLSNDMKIAVQKNHLGCQIWYRSSGCFFHAN